MPTYKLVYFNGRGRAELCRLIFAQAGVQYEDRRVTQEEWQELKPTTPFGTIPILQVDDKMLSGSTPISRYLAENLGLAGSNDIENCELAGIGDFLNDLVMKLGQHLLADDDKKPELMKELKETHFPKYLGGVEKWITSNNCSDGWIYGQKVTYIDLALFLLTEYLCTIEPSALEAFPALKNLEEAVKNLPNIAKWLKERPVTPF